MAPMARSFSPRGVPTAEVAAYYRRPSANGVELHGADGYLINQFFFDHLNLRNDRYGGSSCRALPLRGRDPEGSPVGSDLRIPGDPPPLTMEAKGLQRTARRDAAGARTVAW